MSFMRYEGGMMRGIRKAQKRVKVCEFVFENDTKYVWKSGKGFIYFPLWKFFLKDHLILSLIFFDFLRFRKTSDLGDSFPSKQDPKCTSRFLRESTALRFSEACNFPSENYFLLPLFIISLFFQITWLVETYLKGTSSSSLMPNIQTPSWMKLNIVLYK